MPVSTAVRCQKPISGKPIGAPTERRSKRWPRCRWMRRGRKPGSSWPSGLATRSRTITWQRFCWPRWPGAECEYFDDLRRAARFGPVLGKLVTLDEYFRETREADDWTNFYPREYPSRIGSDYGTNPISSRVDAYRRSVVARSASNRRRTGRNRRIYVRESGRIWHRRIDRHQSVERCQCGDRGDERTGIGIV